MFLVNVIVLKYNGKYPFLEHRLSIFCKTFCNHPFLKGYYIYFWRSLTGIHCVLIIMYFRFIAVFCFVFCFFLSRIFVFIYLTTLTAVTYQIKWIGNQLRLWFLNGACLFRKTICSKFCLKGTVFSARKNSFFHGECINFKSFVTVIHCLTHTTRCFNYRYTNEIKNSIKCYHNS